MVALVYKVILLILYMTFVHTNVPDSVTILWAELLPGWLESLHSIIFLFSSTLILQVNEKDF